MKNGLFQCLLVFGASEIARAANPNNLVMFQKRGANAQVVKLQSVPASLQRKKGIREKHNSTLSDNIVDAIGDWIDKFGRMNFEAFVDAAKRLHFDGDVKTVFDVMDVDKDGHVTGTEFVKGQRHFHKEASEIENHIDYEKYVEMDRSVTGKDDTASPTPTPTSLEQGLERDMCQCVKEQCGTMCSFSIYYHSPEGQSIKYLLSLASLSREPFWSQNQPWGVIPEERKDDNKCNVNDPLWVDHYSFCQKEACGLREYQETADDLYYCDCRNGYTCTPSSKEAYEDADRRSGALVQNHTRTT